MWSPLFRHQRRGQVPASPTAGGRAPARRCARSRAAPTRPRPSRPRPQPRRQGGPEPEERGVPVPPGARAAGVISREASRSPRGHAGRGCGRGARRGGAGARAPPRGPRAGGRRVSVGCGPPGAGRPSRRPLAKRQSLPAAQGGLRGPSVTVRGLALSRKPHLSVFKPHVRPRDVPSL